MQRVRGRYGGGGLSVQKIPKGNSPAIRRISVDLNTNIKGTYM